MENYVLNTIIHMAKQNGFHTIVGEYIPTAKNEMVRDHYLNLGFEQWDGVWNGETLPSDTYFYTIELNYNKVRYKGTVTILR
jgi:predicted enzyme involved in methoxymalonyl-ACP biosynthesis